MRFKDQKSETAQMISNVCLILSLGAIFLQIWVLLSSVETFLEGNFEHLGAALLLSGIALLCCALTAFTTTFGIFQSKGKTVVPDDAVRDGGKAKE